MKKRMSLAAIVIQLLKRETACEPGQNAGRKANHQTERKISDVKLRSLAWILSSKGRGTFEPYGCSNALSQGSQKAAQNQCR